MKNVYIAKTGSQYHRVNGFTFRISDHDQPSHYQMKNYFDVSEISDIERITSNPLFDFNANPIEEDGEFYNCIYDECSDEFQMVLINNEDFDNLKNKIELKRQFFIENGFKGELAI